MLNYLYSKGQYSFKSPILCVLHENYEKWLESQILFSVATDDSYDLKEDSDCYHHIHGQLHFINKMCCDLILWTLNDLAFIRIAKDANWAINIEMLTDFYFTKFIPAMIKN